MAKPIALLDLLFLLIETKDAPAHVGALMVFNLPERAGPKWVAGLAASYRRARPVAPFDQLADFSLRSRPRWKKVDRFDMAYHVQHLVLPPGAGRTELNALVSELHSQVLDRHRPGFRACFIEGLPGRQFAMFFKIHHSLVDGQSAVARVNASLAADPGRSLKPFFAVRLGSKGTGGPREPAAPAAAPGSAALKQVAAMKDLSLMLLRKGLSRGTAAFRSGSAPFSARRARTNAPARAARSFASVSLPLAELKSIGKVYGGTINDVVVTLLDAALVRFLGDHGEPPAKPLVAMCPVSLREAHDTEATTKASAIFVPLGTPRASVATRLRQVIAAARAAKEEMRSLSTDAAMLYGMTALGIATTAERLKGDAFLPPLANFVLSNVAGAPEARYLRGASLVSIHPTSALALGVGLNATLLSYAGSMEFGLVGNGAAMPDLEPLANHVARAYEDLRRASRRAGPRAATG